jgi:hypothetical protein
MVEPGLDLHEWRTRWEELQEMAADEPDRALPEIVRFVRHALEDDRRFDLSNEVVEEGEAPEIVRSFLAAEDIAGRIDAGAEIDAEDVQTALDDLREIYEYLVTDRAAP